MRSLLLLLFFLPTLSYAQLGYPRVTKLKTVDKRLRFRGKMQEAFQWKDKLGENVLITSVLGPYNGKNTDEQETQTVELFAVHYVKADTGYRVLWRMNDLVKDCEFDITGMFIKGSATITDLDKDSTAETKIQYKLSCRSDVSPSYMKLIMHEDSVKYALRGQMWVWAGGDQDSVFRITEKDANLARLPPVKEEEYEKLFGRYESEKDFAKAPQDFLLFARREWLKYAAERFGD